MKLGEIVSIINKIIELQEKLDTVVKGEANASKRKKLQKACRKAIKDKSLDSCAAIRKLLYKV